MATIRPLEATDLPAVDGLLRRNLEGWSRGAEFLEKQLLDHPWTDEQPVSAVAVEDGETVGFLGAQSRPVLVDGERLRGVCISQLAVESERRPGASGALLLGGLLRGPQAVTWVDSCTDLVVRLWRTFGGDIDHPRNCDWMLVLRPARWVGDLLRSRLGGRSIGREGIPVAGLPGHALRAGRTRSGTGEGSEVVGEDASTESLVEALPDLTKKVRFRVDYDAASLDHQFDALELTGASVRRRLVRLNGRPVGSYVYLARRERASRVLSVTAQERHADAVFGDLVSDARAQGCAVLTGRLEPNLPWPLRDRSAILGFGLQPMLHTHRPELGALLATSASALTELECVDSAWW